MPEATTETTRKLSKTIVTGTRLLLKFWGGDSQADLGTPVHTLKSLMGHSNIQTTMKFYIKNNDENSMKVKIGLQEEYCLILHCLYYLF